ncbi:hypothetical protein [Thermosediminibacter oceani]|uniref:hypothetical protein n=1 Tax=Thermosediminibacter oceani TaxID=291990 RepID=UPI00059E952F|nr:hypothetical protein [Thermosediminibacter oceani]
METILSIKSSSVSTYFAFFRIRPMAFLVVIALTSAGNRERSTGFFQNFVGSPKSLLNGILGNVLVLGD